MKLLVYLNLGNGINGIKFIFKHFCFSKNFAIILAKCLEKYKTIAYFYFKNKKGCLLISKTNKQPFYKKNLELNFYQR